MYSNSSLQKIIEKTKESLSPEEKERYDRMGKEIYNTVDFKNNVILNNSIIVDDTQQLIENGYHISLLSQTEQQKMKEKYGLEWYKRWGYNKEDLYEIKTIINTD
jgi:hypothetical protein